MFESDDWTFEDAFNDSDKKVIQSYPFQCQDKAEISSFKRRKVEDNMASSSAKENAIDSKSNVVVDTQDRCKKTDLSRENLLLSIFQKNTCQQVPAYPAISSIDNRISKSVLYVTKEAQCPQLLKNSASLSLIKKTEDKTRIKSANKAKFNKKAKLVRIFPGPAGLVSDVKDENIPTSCLYNMKELESKSVTNHIKTNFSKSQDEKSLFDEKAWKLLLNDLPNNFLKEYGIFTIKDRANTSHCDSTKVKFIAGILDYVDRSCDDPFIILKDSTGSIEGTIHRNITLNYPGMLEPNVAILLHDIGLLKTTTCIVTNKYHILVSQENLLAIYSSKGRIVCESRMEDILSDISNIQLTRDHCTIPSNTLEHSTVPDYFNKPQKSNDVCDNTILGTSYSVSTTSDKEPAIVNNKLSQQSSGKRKSYEQVLIKNNENSKVAAKAFESFEDLIKMDDDMNDFLFIENNFTTSDEQKYLNCVSFGTSVQSNAIQQSRMQMQSINSLENTKKELVVNVMNNTKENNSLENLEKQNQSAIEISSLESKDKISKIQSTHSCKNSLFHDDISCKTHTDSDLNVTSALSISKSKAISKPENFKSLAKYFTGEKFIVNEYDSDDEMLSQLDIDETFNNHKKGC